MLTKAQQVRQYQQARALAKRAHFPAFGKYRPDQARDDHGRFADEGKGGGRGGSGRAVTAPGERGWDRAARYATNAANIATIAALGALALPHVRGVAGAARAATTAGRAAAARARASAMRAKPGLGTAPALRVRDQAMLATAYQNYDDVAASLAGLQAKQEKAKATYGALSDQFRMMGRSMGDREADFLARKVQRAEIAWNSATRDLNAARRRQSELRTAIQGLERSLAGKKPRTAKRRQTFAKYSPDQRREPDGRFADEGKGGAAGGGWERRAAIAGSLLAAGAVATPQGRALAAAGLMRAARGARAGNLAATRAEATMRRRERAKLNARLQGMLERASAGSSRSRLRSTVRGAQAGLNRADAAAERRILAATSRLPPRAREAVRRELRQGSAGPDPAGKLIELPSWMWPL